VTPDERPVRQSQLYFSRPVISFSFMRPPPSPYYCSGRQARVGGIFLRWIPRAGLAGSVSLSETLSPLRDRRLTIFKGKWRICGQSRSPYLVSSLADNCKGQFPRSTSDGLVVSRSSIVPSSADWARVKTSIDRVSLSGRDEAFHFL